MRTITSIFLLLAAPLSLGCASYETMDLDADLRAGHFVQSREKEGLVVAAESYLEARKSQIHFWFDLGDEGFLPVVLYLDNLSDRGFILTRKKISLFLGDGTELATVPVEEVVSACRYGFATSILYFPFFVFVGPIWSMVHRANLNFDMEVDYRRKDLFRGRSAMRIPRKSDLSGAVFFTLPSGGEANLDGATVQVFLTREKGAGESAPAQVKFLLPLK